MSKIPFNKRGEVGSKFYQIFGISFSGFYDGMMSAATKSICIDILKFDDWLHDKYGDYESTGESMRTLLEAKYNKEASDFIESLI